MVNNTNTEALLYVEKVMRKKKWDYKKLAEEGKLAVTTLRGFQKGKVPHDATVRRMAGALKINANEISKRLVTTPTKAKRVSVTVTCAHCGEEGTVNTTRPKYVKYPHKDCSNKALAKKNRVGVEKKKKVRDSDRIKMMPLNETYIRNALLNEQKRECLSCGKKFLSRDIGNRICKLCTGNLERGSLQDRRHNVSI